MAFAYKQALGLQGIGDTAPSDQDESTDTPIDSTFVGPSLQLASPAAQANQNALYAQQLAVMSGAVGVPIGTGNPAPSNPAPTGGVGSLGIAVLLLAGGFIFVNTVAKR